jgi:hypothetical protein
MKIATKLIMVASSRSASDDSDELTDVRLIVNKTLWRRCPWARLYEWGVVVTSVRLALSLEFNHKELPLQAWTPEVAVQYIS